MAMTLEFLCCFKINMKTGLNKFLCAFAFFASLRETETF
jgi:hypothetical protein